MSKKQVSLPSYDYLTGKQVTERLCELFNAKNMRALSQMLEISPSTIATWHQRDICPYEVAIRTHLRKGVSLKWLLLAEGDPYPNASPHTYQPDKEETRHLIDIDLFTIKNGQLAEQGIMTFDQSLLDELGITNVIAIRDAENTYIVDQESTNAVNGIYLIEFDGFFSLNAIQRLPGKKLAIRFQDTTLTVNETELNVTGQVAFLTTRLLNASSNHFIREPDTLSGE
ncbi:Bacteriophage CI repressor helix-turn-helix domain protein [Vibrio aerogenes CECT 7868]|uniref:Bacteriophage CI repressor helix-turn-helix domain protein n=1 Tax=Vibrio aerogenes CECT 7868 TaxID=1216006 RepID=A0A1M5VRT0_9VIBR|nr:helix-turn-helix domain-containing protein [Vibrio aerogenes]SHH77900.1 Bacteriophage CI repressor helix-turn-helix domain protein [Vibrio aerogenes CECT 7868]